MFAAAGAFDLGAWREFDVALTGAAAALIGLVFVAVSLRVSMITRNQELRFRAGFGLSASSTC